MVVNCFNKNADVESLPPNLKVYTIRASFHGLENILCDFAWTSIHELNRHHWMSGGGGSRQVEILEMSLAEYIDAFEKEVRGMNPFWELNKIEFLAKWKQRWCTVDDDES